MYNFKKILTVFFNFTSFAVCAALYSNLAYADPSDSVEECAAVGGILQGTPPNAFCYEKLEVPRNPPPGPIDIAISFSDGASNFEDSTGIIALSDVTNEAEVSANILMFGSSVIFHDGLFFDPGIHTFNTIGGSEINFAVAANQIAIGTYLDWNGISNIFALTILNNADPLSSVDSDFDGLPGNALYDSPLAGINFSASSLSSQVPLPATLWLFGSGLIGLVRLSTRRKLI